MPKKKADLGNLIRPVPSRGLKPLPVSDGLPSSVRLAVADRILKNLFPLNLMDNSTKVLTEATDQDLGDIIAELLDELSVFVTSRKLKLVLSLVARMVKRLV